MNREHTTSDIAETLEWVTIETTRDGYVGRITLSRPASVNTFSTDLATELDDALDYSNERFAERCTTRDAHDGIDAFLDGTPR